MKLETFELAQGIVDKIKELDQLGNKMPELAKNKTISESNYERSLAKTIVSLKNGGEHELEGEKVKNPPVTILEKIAKGICWQEKLQMDKDDQLYRICNSRIEITKSQLNAYQSLNRHLSEI